LLRQQEEIPKINSEVCDSNKSEKIFTARRKKAERKARQEERQKKKKKEISKRVKQERHRPTERRVSFFTLDLGKRHLLKRIGGVGLKFDHCALKARKNGNSGIGGNNRWGK